MGVKSLWTLLAPVGRPVMLETVEGKIMAIDSSIWIYQFQATMRDKEGRALVNAHVLGFLRRLSKLLFYGIKPVFVFDGGAPALKRNTLNERKQKKSGAATSHVKLAEKLLAAQMRREALNHAQGSSGSTAKGKASSRKVVLDENTIYLEDIDPSVPKTSAKKRLPSPSSSAKKNKYHDHDPYRLPEVDLEEAVVKATTGKVPDPRLATEEELRLFIEEMRPEDFDVTSPAFKELPPEVQYEIVGDLRLKSRQTSYARLQKMLHTSRTPLDFSKQQIQNLRQRNTLTQQLLMTTDSIGSAHIAIPVRIASERNKEYVLVKNEGADGGWILGIRDTGTREKPITLDHDDEDNGAAAEDSDSDMEEVEVQTTALPDPDLREYLREMALSAIESRNQPSIPKPINRRIKSNTLFEAVEEQISDPDDDILAYAVQRSLEESGPKDPRLLNIAPPAPSNAASASTPRQFHHVGEDNGDEESIYASPSVPSRLETALSIAGAGPSRVHTSPTKSGAVSSLFGKPTLLSSPSKEPSSGQARPSGLLSNQVDTSTLPSAQVAPLFGATGLLSASLLHTTNYLREESQTSSSECAEPTLETSASRSALSQPIAAPQTPQGYASQLPASATDSDDDIEMEEVAVDIQDSIPAETEDLSSPLHVDLPTLDQQRATKSKPPTPLDISNAEPLFIQDPPMNLDEDDLIPWSRSPSPTLGHLDSRPTSPTQNIDWDAANEVDIQAEEGEFARFISQVKGKNMSDVRKEIDDEIKHLNEQRKAAMRDSEDITQQMIAQIMTLLRLFGIPYITAPMEAEAQCAELVSLNLVDGVITDDSDVFLFGAQRVYKNMFNQSKTVECFLLTDLSRELGLDRDTLVQLAYLLGSDYTEGLPGVGPVVAMELLKEFPGRNGLHKFKEWWNAVQTGKDRDEDNRSKFRKQFKRKFKKLYLPSDWPNLVVRDAYYHPTVDSSEEPFKWGMPDLDGLRLCLREELGWKQDKVDDLLLPIIQRMNKRNQAAALNMQGNLNNFLDIAAGSGTHAPRQRQAYSSKRLQQVISDFRNRQKSASPSGSRDPSQVPEGSDPSLEANRDGDDNAEVTAPKKRKRGGRTVRGRGGSSTTNRGKGRKRAVKGKARADADADEDESDEDEFEPDANAGGAEPVIERDLRPRPKPRPIPVASTDSSRQ